MHDLATQGVQDFYQDYTQHIAHRSHLGHQYQLQGFQIMNEHL